ncbi:leucine--tRNA ligase [Oligoflexia bacterium]|nr:leucine--tRNA ligase [Oligoflexia bacterium]
MGEYSPTTIEKKWQKYWNDNKTFRVQEDPDKPKFYCLDMFPYPSGAGLHIGHPLGYTATDIYSRYKRMQGVNVLHPMGYDAFGLPAEQHAVNTGEHPAEITEANCRNFTKQMKEIGFSYDWDRDVATCRPDYYHWTQWIFLKLYNSWFDEEQQQARPIEELAIPDDIKVQGEKAILDYQAQHRLAFYADASVNWCPALGTVLSNEEVIDGLSERGGHEVVRKPMKQWMLRITKYADRLLDELDDLDWPENIKEQQRNWIKKRYGTEIDFQIDGSDKVLTSFTTRPDTLFGVTFFVVSPEHPLVKELLTEEYRAKVEEYCEQSKKLSEFARTLENREKTGTFTGSFVVNPINKEAVPVYVGDYVLMSYGTGAVMGVPAHDDRDFEFARKYQLEIRSVIVPVTDDEAVVNAIKAAEVSYTDPGIMLPCDSPVAQELDLEGKPNTEGGKLITDWLMEHKQGARVVNYKLRDWLFSRQRYWGEPIPIVHWEDGRVTALKEEELPLLLPEVKDYKPSDSGESPLAKAKDWLEVLDPQTGMKGCRETNTMPQWAGSSWYYLRFIDPKNPEEGWNKELEKAWMPVDLYIGGAEHAVLHLLYARFWHKVLHDLNYVSTREPFQKLFNQGMILSFAYKDLRGALVPVDEVEEQDDGTAIRIGTDEVLERITAKMSKSLRNVINPDEILQHYGADTLRMYLMFMGPLDASRIWDSKAIMGNHRFLRRAWTLVTDNKDQGIGGVCKGEEESLEARRAINLAVKRVAEDLEELRFNTAIATLMECLNTLANEKVSKATLETFTLLLAPFAPHTAEELWERLGHSDTLAYEPWPKCDEAVIQQQTATVVVQINGKKRATLEVAVDVAPEELKKQVIEEMSGTQYPVTAEDKFITVNQKGSSVPKLVNVILKK